MHRTIDGALVARDWWSDKSYSSSLLSICRHLIHFLPLRAGCKAVYHFLYIDIKSACRPRRISNVLPSLTRSQICATAVTIPPIEK